MSENRDFEWKPGQRGRDIAIYLYEDERGEILFRKVKNETGDPEHPKTFRCERLIDGRWVSKKGILDGVRKIPYCLPKFIKNPTVVIAEGEKDTENLASLGFSATCCHCGAGEWPIEITPCFASKLVYILYDIDTKNREKLPEMVAAHLWRTAKEIYIIDLEPHFLPVDNLLDIHEKDISDYLIRFPERKNKIAAIRNLLRQAKPYVPPEVVSDETL